MCNIILKTFGRGGIKCLEEKRKGTINNNVS